MKKGVIIAIFVFVLLGLSVSAATISHYAEDILPGSFGANHSSGEWDFGNQQVIVNTLNVTNKIVTTTQEELEIDSGLNISSGSLYFPDGSSMTTAASGSGDSLWTNSSGNATFTGGNVGIGTTSPSNRVNIYFQPDVSTDDYINLSTGSSHGTYTGLVVQRNVGEAYFRLLNDNTNPHLNIRTESNGGYNPYIKFSVPNAENAMIIQNDSGNVGIGTSSPDEQLTIYSTTDNSSVQLGYDNNWWWKIGRDNTVSGRLMFTNNQNGVINEFLSVLTNGNVGIGTTSPNSLLQVGGTLSASKTTYGDRDIGLTMYTNGLGAVNAGPEIRFQNTEQGESVYASIAGFGAGADATGTYGGIAFATKKDSLADTTLEESMRIDRLGNVGIGTTDPARILTVNGGSLTSRVLMQNDNTGTTIADGFDVGIESNNDSFVWNYESANLYFGTSNQYRMLIDSSGNVGIGTANPGAKLDVYNTASAAPENEILRLRYTTSTTAGHGGKIAFANPAGTEIGAIESKVESGSQLGLSFDTYNSGMNEDVMYIKSDGNVGIGTTSPGAELEVYDSDGNAHLYLRGGDSFGGALQYNNGTEGIGQLYMGTDTYFDYVGSFNLRSGLNGASKMFINKAGNVGIGTTNPATKLDIGDGSSTDGIITVRGNQSGMQHRDNEGNLDFITGLRGDVSLGNYVFYSYGGHWIFNSGNVGIGTTSPVSWAKLDVAGNIAVNGSGDAAAKLGATNSGFVGTQSDDDFYVQTGQQNRISLIHSTGNMGVGTETPNQKLEVAGSLNATTIYVNTGNQRVYRCSGGTYDGMLTWTASGDACSTGGGSHVATNLFIN